MFNMTDLKASWTLYFLLLCVTQRCCSAGITCTQGPKPVLKWALLNGLYYAYPDFKTDYCAGRCVCSRQPGHSRLAVLDNEDDFLALQSYFFTEKVNLWVDATRPTGTGDYTWGNGCPLLLGSTKWVPGTSDLEPQEGEDGLRILIRKDGHLWYAGFPANITNFPPLCQSASVPLQAPTNNPYNTTWALLGNPPQLIGFFNQPMGRDHAKTACESVDMKLANLNTLFEEVADFIGDNYLPLDGMYWWVAATRPAANSDFTWSNGEATKVSDWKNGQPSDEHTLARVHLHSGGITLTGHNDSLTLSLFICQKEYPANPDAPKQFAPDCLNNTSAVLFVAPTESSETSAASTETSTASSETSAATSVTSTASSDASTEASVTSTASSDASAAAASVTSTTSSKTSAASYVASTASSEMSTAQSGSECSATPCGTTTAEGSGSATSSDNIVLPYSDGGVTSQTMCYVPCKPSGAPRNLTEEQIQEIIDYSLLLLDKRNLSATLRRKNSISDWRPSATATGVLGVSVLALAVLSIVALDLNKLVRGRKTKTKQNQGEDEEIN